MWRRIYLCLILVRLWFALSPSYLHPDENFQGPEVIAGMLPIPCFLFFIRGASLRARFGDSNTENLPIDDAHPGLRQLSCGPTQGISGSFLTRVIA
jgi:hypothetical protein